MPTIRRLGKRQLLTIATAGLGVFYAGPAMAASPPTAPNLLHAAAIWPGGAVQTDWTDLCAVHVTEGSDHRTVTSTVTWNCVASGGWQLVKAKLVYAGFDVKDATGWHNGPQNSTVPADWHGTWSWSTACSTKDRYQAWGSIDFDALDPAGVLQSIAMPDEAARPQRCLRGSGFVGSGDLFLTSWTIIRR
jgi:hypothetical protein